MKSERRDLTAAAVALSILMYASTWRQSNNVFADLSQQRKLLQAVNVKETTTNANHQDEPYDAFHTPSVQCRLRLETWQNDNIDWWMTNPPYPLVEGIWPVTDALTNQTYYSLLMNVLYCGNGTDGCTIDRSKDIASWNWTWQDMLGKTHSVVPGQIEIHSLQIMPRIFLRLQDDNTNVNDDMATPIKIWPTLPNGAIPMIYDLEPYQECSQVDRDNPPPPHVKIGACISRFFGQQDLILEWIAYHRMIGIQHFWLFVNEPFENLYHTMPRHEPDITYIPYNYTWGAHKHNGDMGMVTTVGGWTSGGEAWFQTMANNQCLYLAKQYGLEWIIAPDVDEYIVVKDPSITPTFGNPNLPSPLQQYFDKHHQRWTPERGQDNRQVCLFGGGYGRHPILQANKTDFELTMDFTYRKDRRKFGSGQGKYDGKGAGGRRKCFYDPRVVNSVGIHSKNNREYKVRRDASKMELIELYHFRSPLSGPQEARPDQLVSYSELRDQYRDSVKQELERLGWALPKFGRHVCKQEYCHGKAAAIQWKK